MTDSPEKTHRLPPPFSPFHLPILHPQDVTQVRLDRYGNFKRPEGAPVLKGSPPNGIAPRVRPPHPEQPWSKDAAVEKVREERKRIAEAKAETERIARAVEAAAKRRMRKTKKKADTTTKHAHFDANPESAPIDRPHTPPAIEAAPSPRKTPTRKATVPVYSVAGRKVSLFDLLREKILASGEGDSIAAQRAFQLAADRDGKIDAVAIAAVMRRFNVSATDDAVAAVMTRLDPAGRGLVDHRAFLEAVMDEEVVGYTSTSVSIPTTPESFHGKPKPAKDVAQYGGDVTAMRELIIDKIAQKFEGSVASLRKAFNSFDADGDGAVNESEFRAVLANFLIVPPADVLSSLFATHADPATGRMSFNGFVAGFVPEDIAAGIDPDAEAKIRDGFTDKISGPGDALASAAAAKGGSLLFADARDVLGPDADPELVRRLKELGDDCREGLIPTESLRDAVVEHQKSLSDAAVAQAKRDFIDGFGKGVQKGKTPPIAAPKPMDADDVEEILREKLAAKSAGGAAERRKAFHIFDKTNKGFIDRDAMVEALHHFHLVLRPEDVDSLMAKYDSSGGGKISFQDFTDKLLPDDYPTASAKKARVVDAKIAGFTMELTGLLTEIEEMGGVSGSVARSEAIRAAEQAAKDARVRLPPSAAHHAADAASIDAHLAEHPRVEPAKYIQSIVSIVRAAEEGAIETAGYEKEGVSEKFGDNSYVAPVALTDAGFAKKMSTAELLVVVSEKFSAKVPAGKAATWYYGQLMETGDGGAVTIDVFTRALSSVGLGAVEASDADALFAKITDGASTITVAQFTRALAPGPVRRPDANKLRESFETVDKAQVGALSEEDIRGVLVACDVEVDQAAIDRALSQCAADTDLRGPDAKGKIDYERFARAIGDVNLAGVNKSVAPTLETFGKEEVDVNDGAAEGVEGGDDDAGVKTYSPETLKAMNVGCETPPRGVELGSDVEEPEEPRSPDSLPEPSPGHIEVKQWDGPVVKRINQL